VPDPSRWFCYNYGRLVGTWRSQVSALVWGTRGRRFKSGRPDHHNTAWLKDYSHFPIPQIEPHIRRV
jgi:hypothetical protein